jgi:nucleoside phosphorylase
MVARMPNPLDVLIVAAHASELAGLHDALGSALSKPVRGLHVAACDIGVGLPAASVGTMRSLRDRRPRAVILLGSCGMYPTAASSLVTADPSPLLRAVIPESVYLMDVAVARSEAAFPDPMPRIGRVDRALAEGVASVDPTALRGALATTLGITTSNEAAQRLERSGACTTENLEALGVALACESDRIPFCALLVITNIVGEGGRAQWLDQHAAAAERGARILLDWLESGAPGLPDARQVD